MKTSFATLRCGRRLIAAFALLALALGASRDLLRHDDAPWSSGAGMPAGQWFAAADESQPARLETGGAVQLDKSAAPAPKPPSLVAAAAARGPLPLPYAPTPPPAVEGVPSASPAAHRRPSPTGPPLPA